MSRQLKTEQAHHTQWFEKYYALGASRSHKTLAKELGISVAAVKLVAGSFDWKQRVRERDLQIARQVADKTLQTATQDQDQFIRLVRLAIVKLARAINEDRIKLQGADLDRLIRLHAFLTGSGAEEGITYRSTAAQILAFMDNLPTSTLNEFVELSHRRQQG